MADSSIGAPNLPLAVGAPEFVLVEDSQGNSPRRMAFGLFGAQVSSGEGPAYATRAELLADLAWEANIRGYVTGDSTPAFIGTYKKSGASGAGTWTKIGALPSPDLSALNDAIETVDGRVDLETAARQAGEAAEQAARNAAISTEQVARISGDAAKQSLNQKGQPSGYAGLDASGLVPVANLPAFLLTGGEVPKGTWNASTNSPTITSGSGTTGWFYRVSVLGTTSIDGISSWAVNDIIYFNGTAWIKIPAASSSFASNAEVDAKVATNKSPHVAGVQRQIGNVVPLAAAVRVFAFAGQSNALGNGAGGDTVVNQNVFAWDNVADDWAVAELGNSPFNAGGQNNATLQAARINQQKFGGTVYIVGLGVGGALISTWLPGGTNYNLLKGHVEDAFASAALVAAGVTQVAGFNWNHGEADEARTAAAYTADVLSVKAGLRAEVWGGARMPFIAAEMLPYPSTAFHIPTYRALAAKGDDPYFALISSGGFDPAGIGDNTHVKGTDLTIQGGLYEAALHSMPRQYTPPSMQYRMPHFTAQLHVSVIDVTGDNTDYVLICQNEAADDDLDGMHNATTGIATIPAGAGGTYEFRIKMTLVCPTGLERCLVTIHSSSQDFLFWRGPITGDDNFWHTINFVEHCKLAPNENVYVSVKALTSIGSPTKNVDILGATSSKATTISMRRIF